MRIKMPLQKIFTVKSYIGLYEPRILEFVFHSLYVRARSALRLQAKQLILLLVCAVSSWNLVTGSWFIILVYFLNIMILVRNRKITALVFHFRAIRKHIQSDFWNTIENNKMHKSIGFLSQLNWCSIKFKKTCCYYLSAFVSVELKSA